MAELNKSQPKGINVFCGSSFGNDPRFAACAVSVGEALAKADRELVYGGGQSGLMGLVASSALAKGGRVHGVIPTAFLPANYAERAMAKGERETTVSSMHERKALMARQSSAFVGLPGGYGTLEELAEMVTWTQLSIHCKPVVILNVGGFFNGLRTFVENAISSGFIAEVNRPFMTFVDGPTEDTDDISFNWGAAALNAIEQWERKVAGGGRALLLNWPEAEREAFT